MRVIISTLMIFILSGCSMISLYEPIDTIERRNAKNEYRELKKSKYRQALLGMNKEEVRAFLGKGMTLDNLNYQVNERCEDKTCSCSQDGCVNIKSNDIWSYLIKDRYGKSYYSYSLNVFFENDIVIFVQ